MTEGISVRIRSLLAVSLQSKSSPGQKSMNSTGMDGVGSMVVPTVTYVLNSFVTPPHAYWYSFTLNAKL